MTGLIWYAHDIQAYRRKTGKLTMVQDGAYRRMIDEYMSTGEPLPPNKAEIYRAVHAMTKPERAAVDFILETYFIKEDDGWHNLRADEELIRVAEVSTKRKQAAYKRHANAGASGDANAHAHAHANDPTVTITVTKKESDDERAGVLLERICEILGVVLQADPSRITWKKQVFEMLRDGISEEKILAGADMARIKGVSNMGFIRSCALNPPLQFPRAGPPSAGKDDVLERMIAREKAKENEPTGSAGNVCGPDASHVQRAGIGD